MKRLDDPKQATNAMREGGWMGRSGKLAGPARVFRFPSRKGNGRETDE